MRASVTVVDFIARLKKLQINIQLTDGQLKINAPKGTLTPEMLNELKEWKAEVIDFFRSTQTQVKSIYASIEPVEKKDYYILSPAQKRIYILQQMESASIGYNMPMVIPLTENFDKQQLEKVLKKLIARHESLRTSFLVIEDEPVQRVHDDVDFRLNDIDSGSSGDIMKNLVRPFDLSWAPLLRVVLVRIESSRPVLFVDTHHIINDGVSHSILARELMELYAGSELPPLRLQYKDYAEWQKSEAQQNQVKQQERYWQERFFGELPVLSLSTDYPRPVVQSFEGNSVKFVLAEKETRGLKNIASDIDGTLYMVILSLFTVLLSRLSGQEDIIIGTPTAGRRHVDLEHIIGMFVNTLALRNYPCGRKPFNDFLLEVKESTLVAFENQEYPFEKLVEKKSINRDTGRNPVFDVMFALQNIAALTGEKDEDHPVAYESKIAKFDLTLVAAEAVDCIVFELSYCTRLFNAETIGRFITYFKNMVCSILESPAQRICAVEMLSEGEKRQLIEEFNDKGEPYPNNKTIHELFETQAAKTPDCIAVFCHERTRTGTDNNISMYISYNELNEQSSRLAGLLIEKGVEAGNIVGIMVKRSIEMVIYILGILKTGSAYLPIGPDMPKDRINYMLKESGARIVVGKRYACSAELNCQLLIVNCELLMSGLKAPFHQSSFIIHRSSHLAYIIFTSGSTGKPKGVAISHANISPLLHWGYRHLGLGTKDRFLQNLSYYFDWSVWEIMIALTTGASLYMVPDELLLNPEACVVFMNRNDISVLHVTPSQYQYYLKAPERPWTLKYLFIGAEKLSRELVQRSIESVQEDCRVFNMYGPTECTIISAVLEIGRSDAAKFENLSSVPIGRAVGNIDLIVLDRYLNLCPMNVWGELYITGDCVARGYLNNPELTDERFISKSFCGGFRGAVFSKKAPLVYRSGDLARRLLGGNVEFLGRIDQQVKIRGFRIELGEIESELLKYDLVKEAVVIDRESKTGEKYLCGYIVPEEKFELPLLKEFLSKRLPDYMTPSYFIEIESIPLNPNGKLNRGALPEPGRGETIESVVLPRDEAEMKLAGLWAEVLEIEKNSIGIDNDFFQLGGHSLKATVLLSKINHEFMVRVPLVQVFSTPTIRGLADYLKGVAKETVVVEDHQLVRLKEASGADRGHLFLVHDGSGEVEGYVEFCRQLELDIDCWGIRAEKFVGYVPRNLSIEEMAQAYIKKIKILQSHGPYRIAGWSLGGTIAFEIAYQLEAIGETVSFLGLIDSPAPAPASLKEEIFTVGSEMAWLKDYFPGEQIDKKLKNITDINKTWSEVITYLEENHYSVKKVRQLIPAYLAQIIPGFERLGLRELIYYLNLGRSLTHARALYIPGGKIHTELHHFTAVDSKKIVKESWVEYCHSPIKVCELSGNHYSILKMPAAAQTAQLFTWGLSKE